MGAGLAKQFAIRYPGLEDFWKTTCGPAGRNGVRPGSLVLWTPAEVRAAWTGGTPSQLILMFPTKEHWKQPSHLSYIERGLQSFCRRVRTETNPVNVIRSVAFPALGCGLGGLRWTDVRSMMIEYLKPLDIPVEVYEP